MRSRILTKRFRSQRLEIWAQPNNVRFFIFRGWDQAWRGGGRIRVEMALPRNWNCVGAILENCGLTFELCGNWTWADWRRMGSDRPQYRGWLVIFASHTVYFDFFPYLLKFHSSFAIRIPIPGSAIYSRIHPTHAHPIAPSILPMPIRFQWISIFTQRYFNSTFYMQIPFSTQLQPFFFDG